MSVTCSFCFFFFNDTATTEIYTLSLHDALPICTLDQLLLSGLSPAALASAKAAAHFLTTGLPLLLATPVSGDRKSTRLNSSHANISYAVFCLKKKKDNQKRQCSVWHCDHSNYLH